jgi:glycosyltransferase involved in cell wall biosynthesis
MLIIKVPPSEVETYLAASDVALSFVRAGYATASRSPTKIPEYLACGLPIIANRGVGDVDELLSTNGTGWLVDNFTDEEFASAISSLSNRLANRLERSQEARREFDLENLGGRRYRRLYRHLAQIDFHDRPDFE